MNLLRTYIGRALPKTDNQMIVCAIDKHLCLAMDISFNDRAARSYSRSTLQGGKTFLFPIDIGVSKVLPFVL